MLALGGLQHSRRQRNEWKAPASRAVPTGTVSRGSHPDRRARPAARSRGPLLVRVPQWEEAYPWLAHGFSTRSGGVSSVYRPAARIGELNLGLTSQDSRENVLKNREMFLHALLAGKRGPGSQSSKSQPSTAQLVLLRQVHSGLVHRFARRAAGGCASLPPGASPVPRGDGAITADRGLMLGIQTADCLPILVADVRQRIVAAFHAGWRGTLARIAERGVGRMRAEFGSRPGDLVAAIGPGIGHCCYAVGEEVRAQFSSQFTYADALFEEVFDLDPIKQKYPMLFLTARAPGHSNLGPGIHLNLAEANRRQLLAAGLPAKNIHATGLCTACDTKHFFSHRCEQGFTGRMLGAIGLR